MGITLGGIAFVTLVLVCKVLSIHAVADLFLKKGTGQKVFFSIITIAVASYFALSSYNILKKNKMLGYVSGGLVVASAFLVLLAVWAVGAKFLKATVAIALLSVLFNFIVGTRLKLRKKMMPLQLAAYAVVTALVLLIECELLIKSFKITRFTTIIVLLAILSAAAFITIAVLSNKEREEDVVSDEYVKIKKSEYEELKAKAAKYDALENK